VKACRRQSPECKKSAILTDKRLDNTTLKSYNNRSNNKHAYYII
jgi:hypothetical protein